MFQLPGVFRSVPVTEFVERDFQSNLAALAGFQAHPAERLEFLVGPFYGGADAADIKLDHFVGVHRTFVGEQEGDLDLVARHLGLGLAVCESDIGEAVSEGVHRLDSLGVEPAVAHVEAFRIFAYGLGQGIDQGLTFGRRHFQDVGTEHQGEKVAAGAVAREIAQGVGRRILQFCREGEREFARRGDVAEENFGQRGAAFGTVPPTLDDGRGDRLEDLEVGGSAGDQHGSQIRIGGVEGLDDFFLAAGEFDILPVGAFGLDAFVRSAEEEHQVGLLGQGDGLGQQGRIGGIVDRGGFQRVRLGRGRSPAAAREVLVARCVADFDVLAGPGPDALERRNLIKCFHAGAHTAALCLEHGVLADDGDFLHIRLDWQDSFVLEQYDRFLSHFAGDALRFGLGGHLRVGHVVRNGFDGQADAKDLADFLVDHLFRELAGGNGIDDGLAQVIGARHLDVEAVEHRAHRAVRPAPVGDGHSLEAPLAAENLVEEVLVFGAVVAVDLVVGRHHAHRAAFFDGALERLEIDLAERALVDLDIDAAAAGLLVVDGEVLDAHGRSLVLYALGVIQRKGG